MKTASLIIVPTLVAALVCSGCNDSTTRSDYPDRTEQTKAEADHIRRDGELRRENVERDLQQTLTALGFEEQQVVNKSKQERERIAIDRDQKVQPLMAKLDQAEAQAKREIERIDQEAKAKSANTPEAETATIEADAAKRIAAVRQEKTEKQVAIEADIREAKQAADARLAKVDENEAKEKATIATKRMEAEREAREDKLAIDRDTTTKLDRLGKDSAERRDEQRERTADQRSEDQRITAEVKEDIARRGEPARGVTVSTQEGVVTLSGSVAADTVRQQVANDAQKISGVVRVDNRIAVH